MPMIDIQRRHAEVFRIRLGDRDGNRPRKLTDAIRITSRGSHVVQAFADVYGGQLSEWEGQWQAYLPTSELRILVLPGQSIQQWWELYRGSVCERRCDGFQEQKSGKRCMCPEDIQDRVADRHACSPTTRVNVLCPDVAVVGAGALVTHGLIAAETLPQSIAVAETALARGMMVPAVLRVVEHRGRNHFIVPQIEIAGVSLNALTSGDATGLPHATGPLAVTAGEERANGSPPANLTPVPASVPERPVASVAEQAAAVNEDRTRPQRRNAQAPLPSTGVRPRTAQEAAQEAPAPREAPPDAGAAPPKKLTKKQTQKVVVSCKEAGLDDDGRHALVGLVTDGRTESSAELYRGGEMDQALVLADAIAAGLIALVHDGPGGDAVLLKSSDSQAVALPVDVDVARRQIAAVTADLEPDRDPKGDSA